MIAVIQQDIGGLDVPVDQSLPMRMVQGPRRVGYEAHDSGRRDSLAADSIGWQASGGNTLSSWLRKWTISSAVLKGDQRRRHTGASEPDKRTISVPVML